MSLHIAVHSGAHGKVSSSIMSAAPNLPQPFCGRGLRVPSAASSASESGARSDVHSHLRVPSNCREFGMCLLRTPLPPAVYASLYF